MRDWISKAFFYLGAFIDGSLKKCPRCGAYTEVLELGQQFNLHFDTASRGRNIPRPRLRPNIAQLKLCCACTLDVENNLGLHVDCCATRPDLRVVR
jgi:hypothetical protein